MDTYTLSVLQVYLSRILIVPIALFFAYISFKFIVLGEFVPSSEKIKKICKIILMVGFPAYILSLILYFLIPLPALTPVIILLPFVLLIAFSGYFDVIVGLVPIKIGKYRFSIPIARKPGKVRGLKFWSYFLVWVIINVPILALVIDIVFS